jgi:hypothetical protein
MTTMLWSAESALPKVMVYCLTFLNAYGAILLFIIIHRKVNKNMQDWIKVPNSTHLTKLHFYSQY